MRQDSYMDEDAFIGNENTRRSHKPLHPGLEWHIVLMSLAKLFTARFEEWRLVARPHS